jgi:deazaflavin-dependent oxidoreductase (nitroreductase family)
MSSSAQISFIVEHTKLYKTDPEKAHMWDSTVVGGPGPLPTLLLTTIGRKSGKPRPSPLIYQEVDGGYAVVASKGGMPDNPFWYENLVANPECELQIGRKSVSARARTAEGEERERIWKIMTGVYPPYDDYQRNTTRRIPIVVLEPISQGP